MNVAFSTKEEVIQALEHLGYRPEAITKIADAWELFYFSRKDEAEELASVFIPFLMTHILMSHKGKELMKTYVKEYRYEHLVRDLGY